MLSQRLPKARVLSRMLAWSLFVLSMAVSQIAAQKAAGPKAVLVTGASSGIGFRITSADSMVRAV